MGECLGKHVLLERHDTSVRCPSKPGYSLARVVLLLEAQWSCSSSASAVCQGQISLLRLLVTTRLRALTASSIAWKTSLASSFWTRLRK